MIAAARRVASADDVSSLVDVIRLSDKAAERAEVGDSPRATALRVRRSRAGQDQQDDAGESPERADVISHLIPPLIVDSGL
jgi:hypothetical protein